MAQYMGILIASACFIAVSALPTTASPSSTPSTLSPQECADLKGFQSNTTKQCFIPVNETKSFIQAELYCNTKFNGHLASIHNGFDNLLVTDYARSTFETIDNFYIGLDALDTPNRFTWLDGTPVDYANWKYNNYAQKCATVDMKTATWEQTDCFSEAPFVCSV